MFTGYQHRCRQSSRRSGRHRCAHRNRQNPWWDGIHGAGAHATAAETGRVWRAALQSHLAHLHRCVDHQHWTLQRSRSWRLVDPWGRVLLQDRCRTGCGRHPRRPARRHHHLPGSRYPSHGQEERHRTLSALGGDTRLHLRHLLRQDRHPDHQPDVRLQGKSARNILADGSEQLQGSLKGK